MHDLPTFTGTKPIPASHLKQRIAMQIFSDFIHLMLDRRVSLVSKLVFIGLTGIYIALPIDLIPDFLLPLGVVDDGGMILAAAVAFTRHARRQVEPEMVAAAASGDVTVMPADAPSAAEAAASGDATPAPLEKTSPKPAQSNHVFIHRDSRGSGVSCGCLALIALLFIAPFVGMAIVTLSSGLALSGFIAPIFDFINPPASVNVISSRTIVNSLQELGQLVTVRSEFSKDDLEVSIQEGFLNSGYHRANHDAVGSIEAGVDITQFSRDDVRYNMEDGSIHLTLPPPMITSCNVEHINQREYSISLLQKDWDAIRQLAEYEAIMQFRQDALERGLLEQAKEEITVRLGGFLNTLTGSLVHIEFKDSAADTVFGATCQPFTPDGWGKDENGEWVRTD